MLKRIAMLRPTGWVLKKQKGRSRNAMFITVCHLRLDDYLFYASREIGRLYETEKYLHNYGLTYALGLVKSPYANLSQVPRYGEDFQALNEQGVYVTPAYPLHYGFAFSTFKMAN